MKPIFDLVGNTPIIRLETASKTANSTILGKCEFLNPGGSVKDRAAANILLQAVKKGILKTGDTMIEATAGNTGIALVLLANALGVKSVIVMPETQADAKKDALRNLGAELILVPACPLSDKRNFRNTAKRLAREKGWFYANQFNNTDNRIAHINGTVPEILTYIKQHNIAPETVGFICSAGTGGTIGGCALGLKQYNGPYYNWLGRSRWSKFICLLHPRCIRRIRQFVYGGYRTRYDNPSIRKYPHRLCV